jgi:tRNA(Ile)-lysidine synthase
MIEIIILDTVSSYSLFKKGDVVTVALSGGADSIALLYALNQLKNDLGITLKAVHLNHQIRGDEASRDESFVKDFCVQLQRSLVFPYCYGVALKTIHFAQP